MFHYHAQSEKYNKYWEVGKEIDNTIGYRSRMYYEMLLVKTGVFTSNDELVSFNRIIDEYKEKELDKEMVLRLLKEASGIIKNASICQRELALEEYRKRYASSLPSRKHSIWLCDKKGISFWSKQLDVPKLQLFKVCITGELFKTSELFLPNDGGSFLDSFLSAKKYWNPIFENEEQETRAEYLFQGKLKILEKVKLK